MILGESEAEIRWYVPKDMPPGKYRISHSGSHKPLLDSDVKFFIGYTNDFEVNLSIQTFCTLCSRNFQNVKLRIDFVEVR